jgi:hypothetical protein
MKKVVLVAVGMCMILAIGCSKFPYKQEWVEEILKTGANGPDTATPIDSKTDPIIINPMSSQNGCAVPGAIACLPFDNGIAEDISGNGNNGKVVGAVPTTDRFGSPNSALLFNGKTDYVIVEKLNGAVPGNSPKTVSGWFNSNKPNKYLQMLFGFGSPSAYNNFQIGVGPTSSMDDKYQFRVNGWGDDLDWRTGIPSAKYFDGTWHHCAVTYDGTTTKVYFDGNLTVTTNKFKYETPQASSLIIGIEIDLVEWEFDGALDDIEVFSRAIDESEVMTLFNGKPLPPSPHTSICHPYAIACLPFTDGSAQDASGHGNSGTIVGATPTADRFGNPNNALLFNGKTDYVIVKKLNGINPGNMPKTMSGWFNSSKPGKYLQMLFGFGSATTPNNFQIGVGPNYETDTDQFRVNGWGDSYDWRTGVLGSKYFDGKWHHCAVTYDGVTTKVYFDGVLSAETNKFKYVTPEESSLIIGIEIDIEDWNFEGALDDISIFNWAFNEGEIKNLYNEE